MSFNASSEFMQKKGIQESETQQQHFKIVVVETAFYPLTRVLNIKHFIGVAYASQSLKIKWQGLLF